MTTIAWDGSTLSADKMASGGSHGFRTKKVFKLKNGELFAFAGEISVALSLLDWLDNDRDPSTYPQCMQNEMCAEGLLIDGKKRLWVYERTPHPIPVLEKTFALGSGAPYALAAMACGKSSQAAIKVASQFDPITGLGVDALKFGGKI